MKIKNIQFTKIGNGQGFYIPAAYTEDRIRKGLVIGKAYNIRITDTDEGDTSEQGEVEA